MSLEKSVLGIVPGLQATALVGHNLKSIPNFNMKKGSRGMKGSAKGMVKLGITNMVGIGMIKPTASMINDLS